MISIADEVSWRNFLADQIWNSLPSDSKKVRHTDQMNFRCPICGDSKKNLSKKRGFYYISTESYHCFNCETNLTGIGLLKRIAPDGVFHDAMRVYDNFTVSRLGYKPTAAETSLKDELVVCKPIPAWKILIEDGKFKTPTSLTDEAVEYLKSRKVPKFDNFLSIQKGTGENFILIQYRFLGDCIFYQLHNFTNIRGIPKYLFPNSIELNDQEKPPFNIDAVDPSWPYIICCEGVYDALSYKNGVSLGGRSLTEYQKKLLTNRWPRHKLVMAFDNDAPGKFGALKLAQDSKSGLLFMDLLAVFDKCKVKDANDFIRLSDKAEALLKDKRFLESCFKSPLEMRISLMLNPKKRE